MRILFLGNNWAGWQALSWLRERGETVVAAALHPQGRAKHAAEMLACLDPGTPVLDGAALRDPATLARVAELKPDIAVSVFFGYILKAELLKLLPCGAVNVHPAYLPYNRGAHPNVWSIVDGTPAGVTVHYIDEKVDTGDIIGRRQVTVAPADTAETLYRRLESESLALFKELWPSIKAGTAPREKQDGAGTCHQVKDLASLDEIKLDSAYTGRQLINLLRARTFKGHRGAYFMDGGKKVYISVDLTEEKAEER
jgi:methionyl-tRNA formyltransferase